MLTVDPFRDSDGVACLRCRRCRALYRLDGATAGSLQLRPFVDAHQDCTRDYDAWLAVTATAGAPARAPRSA